MVKDFYEKNEQKIKQLIFEIDKLQGINKSRLNEIEDYRTEVISFFYFIYLLLKNNQL